MRSRPLPRALQHLSVLLLALVSVAASTVAAPLIPDALQGQATATTFQIFGVGESVEGGAFDQTTTCVHCLVWMTITDSSLAAVDSTSSEGPVRTLTPGQYQIREYRGEIGIYEIGLRHYVLQLHGFGKLIKES